MLDKLNVVENQVPRKMLKFLLTDGAQYFYGIESSPISQLSLFTLLGCKILVKEFLMSKGIALLDPTQIKVCGGSVAELNEVQPMDRVKNYYRQQLGLAPLKIAAPKRIVDNAAGLESEDFDALAGGSFSEDMLDYEMPDSLASKPIPPESPNLIKLEPDQGDVYIISSDESDTEITRPARRVLEHSLSQESVKSPLKKRKPSPSKYRPAWATLPRENTWRLEGSGRECSKMSISDQGQFEQMILVTDTAKRSERCYLSSSAIENSMGMDCNQFADLKFRDTTFLREVGINHLARLRSAKTFLVEWTNEIPLVLEFS
jgi:hypothetical protein